MEIFESILSVGHCMRASAIVETSTNLHKIDYNTPSQQLHKIIGTAPLWRIDFLIYTTTIKRNEQQTTYVTHF